MSSSGNRINYNLRPAKSVERRMVMDVIKNLFMSTDINKCRYIGFGSPYFSDFRLFHKELHISKMYSFEIDPNQKSRVEFNKPYKCINVEIGKSTALLPTLDWTKSYKDFIWMDYDNELEYDMFNDCDIIFRNAHVGSVYLMTCNKQLSNHTVDSFSEKFGELSPINIKLSDFAGNSDFLTIRKMLVNKINSVLGDRNSGLPKAERLIFKQLFFFTYKDGAPMISFGGLLDYANSKNSLKSMKLDRFDFIRTGIDRYVIDPPNLTYKEINFLNSHLPDSPGRFGSKKSVSFISLSDLNKYRKLYKYLPNYMDVIY